MRGDSTASFDLMQIRRRIKTSIPENGFEKSLEQELLSFTQELAQILNNGLKFEDNFNADIVTIADTGTADSENTVAHDLKRVPIGFVVIKTNKAVSAYDSGTAFTVSNVYVKFATANCAVTLLIF